MEKGRETLDKDITNIFKGVAIIFVILSHLPRIFESVNLVILNPLGYLGVGTFLFLSGYGLQCSYKRSGLQHFWRKRVVKIIPVLSITTIVITVFSNAFDKGNFPVGTVVLSCLGLSNQVNSVTWYIGMMWACYAMFWLTKKFYLNSLWGGIILSALVLVLSILFGKTDLNMWGLNAFSFSIGMIVADGDYLDRIKKIPAVPVVFGIAFCILFVVYYIKLGNSSILYYRNPVKSMISALFLLTFIPIVLLFYEYSIKLRLLNYLGKTSFEIFLIHAPFVFIFPEVFSVASKAVTVPIYLVGTIVLSVLVNTFGNYIARNLSI